MNNTSVLVVEDNADLRRLLREGLALEGFDVSTAANGRDASLRGPELGPDLLVIDIGLPDADGRDLCQALRSRGVLSPVLFLTARDALTDRLSGFSAGGDDYLVKPFEFAELIARLRALERRSGSDQGPPDIELTLDPSSHAVTAGGQSLPLTPTEFRLLGALLSGQRVLRRRELVAAAWPDGAIVRDNTLDVYMGRLRRKLRSLPTEKTIRTVHGVGYALE
ncbi:MAG: response regulator transcription factor [Solirubrobacterales bacterium]